MKKAALTETKNNLSALVDQVQHGQTILILDRGRPVARLISIDFIARMNRDYLKARSKGVMKVPMET